MNSKLFAVFKFLLLTILFFFIFSVLIGMGVYLHFSRNLPNIVTVQDYNPKVISEVFDRNKTR